ncbi:MAG: PEP/pyruvate-binding domain-containing protein [bacterium]
MDGSPLPPVTARSHTPSTGLPALDAILQGVHPGDNIVWQVDRIEDYQAFVAPFVQHGVQSGQKTFYVRFARHEELTPEQPGVTRVQLYPDQGFECFIDRIHETIWREGEEAYFIFDSLSELAYDCYSDRMVGNFFMLTCPFLLKSKAIAYFAVLRNFHSYHAATPIAETTQMLLDVYRYENRLYVHPLKVSGRHSPAINQLHQWDQDRFTLITQSPLAAEILASVPWPGFDSTLYQMGAWNRVFLRAEEIWSEHQRKPVSLEPVEKATDQLLKMTFGRDERLHAIARRYLRLPDLLAMRKRMIGTGHTGGKTAGMLAAHAILRESDPRWESILEIHDSFYIASEVFYTYLVLNDCWWLRRKQKKPQEFLAVRQKAQQCILNGNFPDYIIRRFEAMLDYFGQAPIIARSSSLLEDSFGNMFAGQYETIFLPNQGPRAKRLARFIEAVKRIYASSMSEEVLAYRATRGNLDQDEQMAILVQRVSGAQYGPYFYPHLAGMGYSFNPYVWSRLIDPQAGVVRVVFGLGTRAVTSRPDDYTRVAALNAPSRRPENGADQARRYAQRNVDVLDLENNRLATVPFAELAAYKPASDRPSPSAPVPPAALFLSDEELFQGLSGEIRRSTEPALSFDRVFNDTDLLADLQAMLHCLHQAYEAPVEIEFTANFTGPKDYKINLLQCRPFQPKGGLPAQDPPPDLPRERLLFRSRAAVMGRSRCDRVHRVILVRLEPYGVLPINDRYSLARALGQLTRRRDPPFAGNILLLGPGRWGTTTPSLGVPVSFAEISGVTMLGEIAAMRDDLIPEISLGTHFFSNLVELDILYFALDPRKEGYFLNEELLLARENRLLDLLPSAARFADTLKVADFTGSEPLIFNADAIGQSVVCYLAD